MEKNEAKEYAFSKELLESELEKSQKLIQETRSKI